MKPLHFLFVLFFGVSISIATIASRREPNGSNQAPNKDAVSNVVVERLGDTAFIQLHAPSFAALSARQQALAYWLTQASIAIDPIFYDQLSAYGLQQKRLLEEIVAHPKGIDPDAMAKISEFAKLFWANRGNHNDTTSQKFLPAFTFEQLQKAALTAQQNGAFQTPYADLPPLAKPADVTREVESLRASFFDPAFEPMITAKSPVGGKDTIQASSNTFYKGLSQDDLKGFKDIHSLNSRVVKDANGKLTEEVYRAGTPDGKIALGLYATYLRKGAIRQEALAHLYRAATSRRLSIV